MQDPRVIARLLQQELDKVGFSGRLAFAQEYLTQKVAPEDRETVELIFGLLLKNYREPVPVAVLVHGIRTNAQWQDQAIRVIKSALAVDVVPLKYGIFDAIRFWIPVLFRRGPIKRLLRELRNLRADRGADPIYVVAHSYGTYAITRILRQQSDVKVDRLLLCGSIVPSNFPWDLLPRCPLQIVNLCGTKDIWPLMARCMTWGYGASGRYGFGTARVADVFFEVDHSGFFDEKFIEKNWLPFLASGEPPRSVIARPATPYFELLCQLFPGQWILVGIALVIAVIKLLTWL